MERKSHRRWLWMIPVLLAGIALVVFFWDAILIRVAPKAVLTSALSNAVSQLEERFGEDPLLIFVRAIDPKGRYTAEVELQTENDLLGPVNYDMTVQTDGAFHQLYAEGVAATASENLDLSVYLDTQYIAVSSEDLVNGNYYGITYDSFAEDMRSIPLLNFVISNNTLSRWDASIQDIQEMMNRSYTLPQIPQISEEDMQKLMLGILALPCEIENRSISADGGSLDCQVISYSASGEQVNGYLGNSAYADDAALSVSFYLHEKSLLDIQISHISKSETVVYGLYLGSDPADGPLRLQIKLSSNGGYEERIITVSTKKSEDQYIETWNFRKSTEGLTEDSTYSFEWISSSRKMNITADDSIEMISLNLQETENGFWMQTDDIVQLLQLLTKNEQELTETKSVFCTMAVSKGSQITAPTYKNLDQWSLEDFFILLEGIGSLIGIQIGI